MGLSKFGCSVTRVHTSYCTSTQPINHYKPPPSRRRLPDKRSPVLNLTPGPCPGSTLEPWHPTPTAPPQTLLALLPIASAGPQSSGPCLTSSRNDPLISPFFSFSVSLNQHLHPLRRHQRRPCELALRRFRLSRRPSSEPTLPDLHHHCGTLLTEYK